MTIQLLTIVLFTLSVVFSQSEVNIDSIEVNGGKAYKIDDDKAYTGKVFELYESSERMKLEGQYKKGFKVGKWTGWHKDGKKSQEGIYKNRKCGRKCS